MTASRYSALDPGEPGRRKLRGGRRGSPTRSGRGHRCSLRVVVERASGSRSSVGEQCSCSMRWSVTRRRSRRQPLGPGAARAPRRPAGPARRRRSSTRRPRLRLRPPRRSGGGCRPSTRRRRPGWARRARAPPGATRSQRAMTTFCWLPPESWVTGFSGRRGRTSSAAIQCRVSRRSPRVATGAAPERAQVGEREVLADAGPRQQRCAGAFGRHVTDAGVDRRARVAGRDGARRRRDVAAARDAPGEQPGDLLAARAGEPGDAEHLAGGDLEVEVGHGGAEAGPARPGAASVPSAVPLGSSGRADVRRARGRASARPASRGRARASRRWRPAGRRGARSRGRHRPSTSSRWWEMNRMPVPRRRRGAGRRTGARLRAGQRGGRLVEHQQRRRLPGSSSARATATAVRSDWVSADTSRWARCRSRARERLGRRDAFGAAVERPSSRAAARGGSCRRRQRLDEARGPGGRTAARRRARPPGSRGRKSAPATLASAPGSGWW